MTVTISKLYDTYTQAVDTVNELEAVGIPSRNISIIASDSAGRIHKDHTGAATGATTGAVLGGGAGLLAGLGMIAIPGIGPVVAAGWLSTLAAGAAVGAGAGGIIGALTDSGVDKSEAHVYAEGVRRGGTLVSVRSSDDREQEVERIMTRHKSVDMAARASAYREAGWTAFDPAAPPYAPPREPPRTPPI
jgi:hypothetical protein